MALDSYLAGDRPAQRISFQIEGGELEIYDVRVTYPQEFSLVGFPDLEIEENQVGAFELVFDLPLPPGTDPVSVTAPLIRLGSGEAYADVIADASYSRGLEPLIGFEGSNELTVRLPLGGDLDPTTLVAPFPGRVNLTLLRGPLQNPDRPGSYVVGASIQSVDPDTDDADDGVDPAPQVIELEVPIEIRQSLWIDHARLVLNGGAIRGFRVLGRHASGAFGDLSTLPSAEVEVTFGNFARTLSGEDFIPIGEGWIYVPGESGIYRLLLRGDDHLQLDAHVLDLPPSVAANQETIPVRFSLRVGSHRVATTITFDAAGRHQP